MVVNIESEVSRIEPMNVLKPMNKQRLLVAEEAGKRKTYILPISQLDAVMISLDDAKNPQSMYSSEDE